MPLTRRCPHCKSADVNEKRVAGQHGHGGFYYALVCVDCGRVLERFEVVDIETGEVIATAADEGDYKRVDWRKKSRHDGGRLSGRDDEGMAV